MQTTSKSTAGPVVLMFLAGMGVAWMAYSMLFPQDVITFLIMLAYIPAVGVAAALLYRRLKHKH